MLQQYVWWAVGGLSFFFFILFYRIRHSEGGKSTLLKMKDSAESASSEDSASSKMVEDNSAKGFTSSTKKYRPRTQDSSRSFASESTQGPAAERPLNVMFMYNAMAWDAYEVLGIPAGSSFQKAQEVHSALTKNIDPEAKKFYDVAFESIARQTHPSYKSDSGEGESAS